MTEAEEGPRPRRLTLTAIGVAVAIVVGVVGLVFDLWPDLKPDPRTENRAELEVAAVDHGITVDEWLKERTFTEEAYLRERDRYLNQGPGPKPNEADLEGILELKGLRASVACTIHGFEDRSVNLRWSLYDAREQRRVDNDNFSNVLAVRLKPSAPADSVVADVWVPEPPRRGRYFLRAALYDRDDTQLAVGDSKPFTAP